MKMNKRTVVLAVLVLLAGITLYKVNQMEKVEKPYYPSLDQIMPETTPEPVAEDLVIELPEVVITGKVPKGPVLHGTKICREYESFGITAAHEAGDWLESTCHNNTCFLMVHETTVPATFIMAGWLSEARNRGHDPRKDGIELSVFTFRGGEPFDHVIYFAGQDEFDGYEW